MSAVPVSSDGDSYTLGSGQRAWDDKSLVWRAEQFEILGLAPHEAAALATSPADIAAVRRAAANGASPADLLSIFL